MMSAHVEKRDIYRQIRINKREDKDLSLLKEYFDIRSTADLVRHLITKTARSVRDELKEERLAEARRQYKPKKIAR